MPAAVTPTGGLGRLRVKTQTRIRHLRAPRDGAPQHPPFVCVFSR